MARTLLTELGVWTMLQLAYRTPPGCFVEFGVYQGGSAYHLAQLAREQGRTLHLFDTFTGMPFADAMDTENPVGKFSDTSVNAVRELIPDGRVYPGVFPETMPLNLPPIAFVHLDCDQYRSAVDALKHFGPKIVEGGILLADDYAMTEGVTKAIDEQERPIWRTPEGRAFLVF